MKNRFIKALKMLVVIVPYTALKGERRKKAIRREITNLSHLQWIKEKRKLLKIKRKTKIFIVMAHKELLPATGASSSIVSFTPRHSLRLMAMARL